MTKKKEYGYIKMYTDTIQLFFEWGIKIGLIIFTLKFIWDKFFIGNTNLENSIDEEERW